MRLARRTVLASMMASVAAPALPRLAFADTQPTTLKLHHYFSSVSGAHDRFLAPWARKLEADSGGRIRIELFPSMQLGGAPAQLLDQARDGVADIVFAAPSRAPGSFPKIELFELPFVPARRALVNSKAIQDYAAANLQDEFRDFHAICFSCRDGVAVHARRDVRSLADINGMSLHVANPLAVETVHALGGNGVAMPAPQVPMALAAHVIDGCLDPWGVMPAFKLYDLKSHTEFADQSLSTTAFVLAMNRGAYDRLPRDLKAVIDANSGQAAAGMAGVMWDADAAVAAAAARERGDTVVTLAPEELARWRKATEPVVAAWLKEMKEQKIDGGKLLAGARVLLAKYANEPEPVAPQPQSAQPAQPAPAPERTVVAQPPPAKPELPTPKMPPPVKSMPAATSSAATAVSPAQTAVPVPTTTPAAPAVPVAKPAPVPPKLKFLDIPL